MTASMFHRALALIVTALALGLPAQAKDRPFGYDWRTGVTVAPGALTWTADNFEDKKGLINGIAKARGKTCSHYAFLGWPPGSGGGAVILSETRKNYEADGYTVEEKPGDLPTDTLWTVAKDGREALILWGAFSGSTIYLSCITAGEPAASPDKTHYLGGLLTLGLGGLLGGLWLIRRVRALAAASLRWPVVAGVVKSSEVAAFRSKGGKQFMAKVAYDYTVDSTPYSGDTVRFGNYAGALAKAEADVAKYSAGAPVEVFYDPTKPQTSTLEAGQGGLSVWGLVLAVMGAALTVLAVIVYFFVE
jgi:hypothetical protein